MPSDDTLDFVLNLLAYPDPPNASDKHHHLPNLIQKYQLIQQHYMNPHQTKIYRYLIKHTPGTGKTLAALLIAENFIKANRQVVFLTFK